MSLLPGHRALVVAVLRAKVGGYAAAERMTMADLSRAIGPERAKREVAAALARMAGTPKPTAAKVAKPKTKPAPVVVDDDDDEDDPKPAKKTKTLGGVTFEAPDFGEPAHVHMLGKPTPREQFAKALGMPSHVAATFTDAELTAVAPSFVAMKKGNSK